MTVGHIVRALADSYRLLVVGSALSLFGMGVGNILLPPLVKRYFPDHIGVLTALYITMITFSAAVPAFVVAPVSDSSNWRISVGMWAVLAAVSLVPWGLILLKNHGRKADDSKAENVLLVPAEFAAPIWRSRVAWAVGVTAAVSSFNFFVMFAWLPEMLIQTAQQTPAQAGALLALFAMIGLPASVIVPVVAERMKKVGRLVNLGVVLFVVGYLGLMLVPTTVTWLWVSFVGTGQRTFPVCLF